MKKIITGVLLVLSLVFTVQTGVHAQDNGSVQDVLDEIGQVAETEEEIKQEVQGLTVGEVEDVYIYLTEKENVTETEGIILNVTGGLVSEEVKFGKIVNTTTERENEKERMQDSTKEYVEGMTKGEQESVKERLRDKDKDNLTLEEESLLDELLEVEHYNTSILIVGIGVVTAVIGVVIYKGNDGGLGSINSSFLSTFLIVFGVGIMLIGLVDILIL